MRKGKALVRQKWIVSALVSTGRMKNQSSVTWDVIRIWQLAQLLSSFLYLQRCLWGPSTLLKPERVAKHYWRTASRTADPHAAAPIPHAYRHPCRANDNPVSEQGTKKPETHRFTTVGRKQVPAIWDENNKTSGAQALSQTAKKKGRKEKIIQMTQ